MTEKTCTSKWVVYNEFSSEVEKLAQKYGISKILAKLLVNRNISDENEVELFLRPTWENLHDPRLLSDIDVGVKRILKAIEEEERILVYGDYDVDGVTCVTMLCDFIRKRGGLVDFIIPHRFEDGYGLSFGALEKVEKTPDLIITVDCGINSKEEIAWLKDRGIDVVVTDHHVQVDDLPPALAVINPKREDSLYPFQELSGVGVVFNLIWAMLIYISGEEKTEHLNKDIKEYLLDYLDLVALGTIADLVPLVDENRFFVVEGLKNFGGRRIGLKALLQVSGLDNKDLQINVGHIAFVIAPRINAAGRLESAKDAVYLLMEDSSFERALERAKKLDKENKQRRELEREVFEEANQEIKKRNLLETDYVLVLSSERWHEGVVGIAASKLVDNYHRPVILLSINGNEAKGSCRSILPFNIVAALRQCQQYLKKYGGHEAAAGVTLDVNYLEEFKDKINEYAKKYLTSADLTPYIDIDMVVPGNCVSHDLAQELQKLEPYGMGNPRPVLASTFQLHNLRKVGKDKNHVKLSFSDGVMEYDGIWFQGTNRLPALKDEAFTKVAFTPKINNKSKNNFDLQVMDLKCEKDKKKVIDYRNNNKSKVLADLEKTFNSSARQVILVNNYKSKSNLEKHLKSNVYEILTFKELSEIKSKIEKLILFDLPFDGETLITFVKNNFVEQIYLLYNQEDQKKNEVIWKASIPDENNIRCLFKNIFEVWEENELVSLERIKELFQGHDYQNITKRLLEKFIEILVELSIIEKKEDGYKINCSFKGRFKEELEEIDLECSKTYLEERERLEKILKWEKVFIDLPPVVIFQIFFEDNLEEVEWLLF